MSEEGLERVRWRTKTDVLTETIPSIVAWSTELETKQAKTKGGAPGYVTSNANANLMLLQWLNFYEAYRSCFAKFFEAYLLYEGNIHGLTLHVDAKTEKALDRQLVDMKTWAVYTIDSYADVYQSLREHIKDLNADLSDKNAKNKATRVQARKDEKENDAFRDAQSGLGRDDAWIEAHLPNKVMPTLQYPAYDVRTDAVKTRFAEVMQVPALQLPTRVKASTGPKKFKPLSERQIFQDLVLRRAQNDWLRRREKIKYQNTMIRNLRGPGAPQQEISARPTKEDHPRYPKTRRPKLGSEVLFVVYEMHRFAETMAQLHKNLEGVIDNYFGDMMRVMYTEAIDTKNTEILHRAESLSAKFGLPVEPRFVQPVVPLADIDSPTVNEIAVGLRLKTFFNILYEVYRGSPIRWKKLSLMEHQSEILEDYETLVNEWQSGLPADALQTMMNTYNTYCQPTGASQDKLFLENLLIVSQQPYATYISQHPKFLKELEKFFFIMTDQTWPNYRYNGLQYLKTFQVQIWPECYRILTELDFDIEVPEDEDETTFVPKPADVFAAWDFKIDDVPSKVYLPMLKASEVREFSSFRRLRALESTLAQTPLDKNKAMVIEDFAQQNDPLAKAYIEAAEESNRPFAELRAETAWTHAQIVSLKENRFLKNPFWRGTDLSSDLAPLNDRETEVLFKLVEAQKSGDPAMAAWVKECTAWCMQYSDVFKEEGPTTHFNDGLVPEWMQRIVSRKTHEKMTERERERESSGVSFVVERPVGPNTQTLTYTQMEELHMWFTQDLTKAQYETLDTKTKSIGLFESPKFQTTHTTYGTVFDLYAANWPAATYVQLYQLIQQILDNDPEYSNWLIQYKTEMRPRAEIETVD